MNDDVGLSVRTQPASPLPPEVPEQAEPRWTPGPWSVTTRRSSWDWVVYVEADPNLEICQPFHDGTDDNETGEANSRLIAAAPDLYEALRDLVALCRYERLMPDELSYMAKARAALARVTEGSR